MHLLYIDFFCLHWYNKMKNYILKNILKRGFYYD